MKFITVPITEDMREDAATYADPSNRGRFVTALAWTALKRAFPKTELVDFCDGFDVCFRGKSYEVRAEFKTDPPREDTDCPVYKVRASVRRYLFIYVARNARLAWIVGRITKQKYLEKARHYRPGEIMPLEGGHKYKCIKGAHALFAKHVSHFSDETILRARKRLH